MSIKKKNKEITLSRDSIGTTLLRFPTGSDVIFDNAQGTNIWRVSVPPWWEDSVIH